MTTSTTASQILDQARRLLASGGYSGFSYADIASQIGIRKPSIHHHFPTKADLVQALLAQYRSQARQGLAALDANLSQPLARLEQYVGYWERCIVETSAPICLCALLSAELPVLPEPVAAEVTAHFRDLSAWLASVFAQGQQQGVFQLATTPEQEAQAFMASVHGAMLSARAYGDPGVFGHVMQRVLGRLSPSG